jgi:membrane protein
MIPSSILRALRLLHDAHKQANRLGVSRMAAALALYLLMSLTPLLVLVVGLAGRVVGPGFDAGRLSTEVEKFLGPSPAAALAEAFGSAAQPQAASTATILGLLGLLWGASRVFFALEGDLATLREQPQPAKRKERWLHWLQRRLMAIGFTFAGSLALVLSIMASTLVRAFESQLPLRWPALLIPEFLRSGMAIFGLSALALVPIYRLLPDPPMGWRATSLAALSASLALSAGMSLAILGLRYAGSNAILALALSPFIGLSGLYLGGMAIYYGAALGHVWERGQAPSGSSEMPSEDRAPRSS